ncbi:hypothetical protein PPACK8108_LOCUS5279 [Phakopsora pachyrhizi]|uniref:Uncharacterized protein n=1 Tax=Phakopsora pachyrhizi TaxID=170000 RepID=A0AAV0APZ2_PHAPC|nr:hypothetical protein PPACK8108_LOCUS5279 [Phakopsora pachyrhizi]
MPSYVQKLVHTAFSSCENGHLILPLDVLELLKGPAPSLEVFANFKDLSPLPATTGPMVLRSEQKALGLTESLPIAPPTVIHRMKYILQDYVNKGQLIPPKDLIDLTSLPEDDTNTASFFDLPKSQTLKQPTKKIKLSKNKNHLSRWSYCIASAVQLTAHNLSAPTLSLENLSAENVNSHIEIIEFLENCKSGNPCVEDGNRKLCNDMTLKPLIQLHDSIIDVFITYIIVRGILSFGSNTHEESSSKCLVEFRITLEKFCSRHNYATFCLFLVSGIHGLLLAPLN